MQSGKPPVKDDGILKKLDQLIEEKGGAANQPVVQQAPATQSATVAPAPVPQAHDRPLIVTQPPVTHGRPHLGTSAPPIVPPHRKFLLTMPTELHASLKSAAAIRKIGLNDYLVGILSGDIPNH